MLPIVSKLEFLEAFNFEKTTVENVNKLKAALKGRFFVKNMKL